jgi:ATP synthase protein I
LGDILEDRRMTEKDPADLSALNAKLRAARERNQGPDGKAGSQDAGQSSSGYGLRLSVELIAGLLAGLGLGWTIDWFVGSRPWFMLIFMFLGLGAGVYNVIRLSKQQQEAEEAAEK